MIRRWVWILLLPAVAAPLVGRTPRRVAKSPRPITHCPVPVVGEAPPPPPARVLDPVPQTSRISAPHEDSRCDRRAGDPENRRGGAPRFPGSPRLRFSGSVALEAMLGIPPSVADEVARRLAERDREAERIDEEQRPALDERVDGEIEAFLFGEALELYRNMRADGRIAATASASVSQ